MSGRATVERDPDVTEQLVRLETSVSTLSDMVGRVYARLSQVYGSCGPKNEDTKEEEALCPLGRQLQSIRLEVEKNQSVLSEILNRLEI